MSFNDSPPELDKKEKRLAEILSWLEFYKKNSPSDITYKPNSEHLINNLYWDIADNKVRPRVVPCDFSNNPNTLLHHSKIISIMQYCIMEILPIVASDIAEQRRQCSILALFVAKQIVITWNKYPSNKDLPQLLPFEEEHLKWLRLKMIFHFPIFSNAATWDLYDVYIKSQLSNPVYKLISDKPVINYR